MTPLERLAQEQARVKLGAYHRYTVDGEWFPGVTTIIKTLDAPQLDAWKVRTQVEGTARAAYDNPPIDFEPLDAYIARMKKLAAEGMEHERIAKAAADEGAQVHALIEWRMRTQLGEKLPRPDVSEEASFREAGWLDWAKSVGLRPLAVESRLANRTHRYSGTIDLLAEVEGRIALLDWKRSTGVYDSHLLQSIGYRMALEDLGFAPMLGYVLLMPPGEEPRLALCRDDEDTRAAFLACLHLYTWTKALARDKRKDANAA